jgi:NADPH-dependent 2,4-dienoyl-CoA reductase/sulfur reductase-like enzyme/nitrite reductase/ring-hydroxylating ferredoxin subunit
VQQLASCPHRENIEMPSEKLQLELGIPLHDLPDSGLLLGRVGEVDVLVARQGDEVFAVDALCPHYHAPLVDGLLVGDTVRCPLHHACFSLRTGAAVRAPALDAIGCWKVERVGDTLFVGERQNPQPLTAPVISIPATLESIVIVGGGPAGLAAATTLRAAGYDRDLTLISADDSEPYDRPNLSKDYLEGTAPDDWMPLRTPGFYADQGINLLLNTPVTALDTTRRQLTLHDGCVLSYDGLILATGADAVHLTIPGATLDSVRYLRSFADARALVAQLNHARTVIVLGASFIGLEVAASLRKRGLSVHVVAPDAIPMAKALGPELGRFIRSLHESQGVIFHLGETVASIAGQTYTLSNGQQIEADLLVAGVGVRPSVQLAQSAGLTVDNGVVVDEYLETSARGVYAVGDIAHWPDPHSGERIRVEHYVLAQRQAQTAARNLLGSRERFDAVPFFWSQHYDVTIRYIGHASSWDALQIDGTPESGSCRVRYERAGRLLAVATIGRDVQNLQAEVDLEAQRSNGASA